MEELSSAFKPVMDATMFELGRHLSALRWGAYNFLGGFRHFALSLTLLQLSWVMFRFGLSGSLGSMKLSIFVCALVFGGRWLLWVL